MTGPELEQALADVERMTRARGGGPRLDRECRRLRLPPAGVFVFAANVHLYGEARAYGRIRAWRRKVRRWRKRLRSAAPVDNPPPAGAR